MAHTPARIALLCTALLACGCAATTESGASDSAPAVLIEPDAAGHAELVRVVSDALGVATVTIADDALTGDSMLLIERQPARDAAGRRLTGRDYTKPEQFQLVTNGGRCTLVHLKTHQRYALTQTRCRRL